MGPKQYQTPVLNGNANNTAQNVEDLYAKVSQINLMVSNQREWNYEIRILTMSYIFNADQMSERLIAYSKEQN